VLPDAKRRGPRQKAAPDNSLNARVSDRAGQDRRVPTAFASLYLPTGRRRWHWYAYRCPSCGAYQLGRAPQLEHVTGQRRAGCGHQLVIAIARVYGRSA
jgi:hypothetical protein